MKVIVNKVSIYGAYDCIYYCHVKYITDKNVYILFWFTMSKLRYIQIQSLNYKIQFKQSGNKNIKSWGECSLRNETSVQLTLKITNGHSSWWKLFQLHRYKNKGEVLIAGNKYK